MKKEVMIGEFNVGYLEEGEGIPIIVLHGWDDGPEKYLEFQKVLSRRGFKVFLPQIPGLDKELISKEIWSAEDYAQWLFEFSEKLEIKNFFLLGHSFGTLLSIAFAALYPEKLLGLIIFAPPRGGKEFCPLRIVVGISGLLPFLNKIKKFLGQETKLSIERNYGIYKRSNGKMMKSAANIFSENIECYLKKIKIPILVVYGKKDNRLIVTSAKKVFRKIPHAVLAVFEKGDHFVQEKYPNELSDTIKKFTERYFSEGQIVDK